MGARQQVGIVGAGPAGMMAALEAAKRGARVLLFDRNQIVGRKLLVTGNGRCNLTNVHVAPDRYTCADPAFLEGALGAFGRQHLLAVLHELGVLTYATPDGWTYPLSNSAAAVVDLFAAALDQAGVDVHLQTKISAIRRTRGRFLLQAGAPSHTHSVDRVIVAAGGKAYPALGSKGECFPILKELGHTIVPIRPALAPIRAEVKQFHKLQGVRLDVGLALYQGEKKLGETVGNLMFTQFGDPASPGRPLVPLPEFGHQPGPASPGGIARTCCSQASRANPVARHPGGGLAGQGPAGLDDLGCFAGRSAAKPGFGPGIGQAA